jgi:aryl-alcohol dehydrogenase-like predicted oxidoreductase
MELSYASYGTTPSEDDQFALLDRALELGAAFWDTSEYVFAIPRALIFNDS